MGVSTPPAPACMRLEMVLSAGTEKKAAFLIKKKVSNFSGYKTDKIKKKKMAVCTRSTPSIT